MFEPGECSGIYNLNEMLLLLLAGYYYYTRANHVVSATQYAFAKENW